MKQDKERPSYVKKEIDAFATCAVKLYGVVTIRELHDIWYAR